MTQGDWRHQAVRSTVIAAALNLAPGGVNATCTKQQVLEPADSFPALSGRMVYHAYVGYADGTSNLYLYDFLLKSGRRLSLPGWNIVDPMNAQFSPDGLSLIFMGQQNGQWHVFAWTIGAMSAPLNLTVAHGGNNEDPKFTFDGQRIVIKHDGMLEIGTLTFDKEKIDGVSEWQPIAASNHRGEASMPSLSPSGKYLFYAAGSRYSSINRINLQTGEDQLLTRAPSGAHDYYPVVRDFTTVFFTRGVAGSGNDQIMRILPGVEVGGATTLPLNDCSSNNSDPAPADEDFLIFSSGRYDPPYGLMIGEIIGGKVWRMPRETVNIADGLQKLGATYTASR